VIFLAIYLPYGLEIAMLKDFFDFSKNRSGLNAVLFYLFYVGCFAIVSVALGFDL
jgi:hypothetical protein